MRGAVVRPLARRIGVMDQDAEAGALPRGRPREHLEVAVRVAERDARAHADAGGDPNGLPLAIVDEVDLAGLDDRRHAVAQFVAVLGRASDDLVGRNAVDLARERAHEVDAAARDDEGSVAVRAQAREHLDHRPIHHLVVAEPGLGMARGVEPRAHGGAELLVGHAAVRRRDERAERVLALRGDRLRVALQERRKRLGRLPLRMRGAQRLHAVDDERELHIHRLLGPERAVVVEDGDALGLGHEVDARRIGRARDERHDRGARGAFAPRFERRGRRPCHGARITRRGTAGQEDWNRRGVENACRRDETHRLRHWPCGFVTASMTRSRLKLPGFWRGGKSRKLCSQRATYAPAGAIANMRSRYQRW